LKTRLLGSFVTVLLQFRLIVTVKKFENWSIFDEVIRRTKSVPIFWATFSRFPRKFPKKTTLTFQIDFSNTAKKSLAELCRTSQKLTSQRRWVSRSVAIRKISRFYLLSRS